MFYIIEFVYLSNYNYDYLRKDQLLNLFSILKIIPNYTNNDLEQYFNFDYFVISKLFSNTLMNFFIRSNLLKIYVIFFIYKKNLYKFNYIL